MGKERWQREFDVPMGSFNGAEICEMVGLYILNAMTAIVYMGLWIFKINKNSSVNSIPVVSKILLSQKDKQELFYLNLNNSIVS